MARVVSDYFRILSVYAIPRHKDPHPTLNNEVPVSLNGTDMCAMNSVAGFSPERLDL